MSWRGRWAHFTNDVDIRLPPGLVARTVKRHEAQSWFVYAYERRRERKHVWWPSLWLVARLRGSTAILETGCGCGLNLLWFAQNGFARLSGFDNDATAIAVGRELFKQTLIEPFLWVDEGLSPTHLPQHQFGAILALNWTYHANNFDLLTFLQTYRPKLTARGYLALDAIDRSYDKVPNNQYLTSDWERPERMRRPTEYKTRYFQDEVIAYARTSDFRVVESTVISHVKTPPRLVFILTPLE